MSSISIREYTKSLSGWRAVLVAGSLLVVLGTGALVIANEVAIPAMKGTVTGVANFFMPK